MRSKLFLSLSLLTAVFSMQANTQELVFPRWHKDAIQWMYKNPNGKTHPVNARFAAKHLNPSQMSEALFQVAPQSLAEAVYAQAWVDYAKTANTVTATTASSKAAQFAAHPTTQLAVHPTTQLAVHPTTQHAALAAGTLVAGTAIAGATVYGAQKAYNYMYPKQEVQPTRFERVKSVLNNGYTAVKANAVKGYNLALENKGKTAGAVAAVAALGLVAYKYSDSIFGKSKVVVAPVAPVQKAPARVAYVRTLRD